jgi:hypothetical protein
MTPTSAPALTPWMVSSHLSPEGLAPAGMAHTGLYVFQPPSGYVLKRGYAFKPPSGCDLKSPAGMRV